MKSKAHTPWIVRLVLFPLFLVTLHTVPLEAQEDDDPAARLEQAIVLEESEKDFEGAIAVYRSLFESETVEAALCARAGLRLGKALLALGRHEEARAVFSRVSGGEGEAATEAREVLGRTVRESQELVGEINRLLTQLRGGQEDLRSAETLVWIGEPSVPVVIQTLRTTGRNDEPLLRVLLEIGGEKSSGYLRELATGQSLLPRRVLIDAASNLLNGRRLGEGVAEALLCLLDDPSPRIREQFLGSLGSLVPDEKLRTMMRDSEPRVRRIALGIGAARPLEKNDWKLRYFLAAASGLLNDPDPLVRDGAFRALLTLPFLATATGRAYAAAALVGEDSFKAGLDEGGEWAHGGFGRFPKDMTVVPVTPQEVLAWAKNLPPVEGEATQQQRVFRSFVAILYPHLAPGDDIESALEIDVRGYGGQDLPRWITKNATAHDTSLVASKLLAVRSPGEYVKWLDDLDGILDDSTHAAILHFLEVSELRQYFAYILDPLCREGSPALLERIAVLAERERGDLLRRVLTSLASVARPEIHPILYRLVLVDSPATHDERVKAVLALLESGWQDPETLMERAYAVGLPGFLTRLVQSDIPWEVEARCLDAILANAQEPVWNELADLLRASSRRGAALFARPLATVLAHRLAKAPRSYKSFLLQRLLIEGDLSPDVTGALVGAALIDEDPMIVESGLDSAAAFARFDPSIAKEVRRIAERLESDPGASKALEVLVQIEGREAFDLLVETLASPSGDLRRTAVNLLFSLGDERAVPHLVARLDDADQTVRNYASRALESLRMTAELRSSWRSWQDGTSPESAVTSLLRRTDSDQDKKIRLAALRSLGALGREEALAALVELMTDEDPDVSSAAEAAVERIASREGPAGEESEAAGKEGGGE